MSKTIRDRTLALAGVYQAVYLVQQVATKGMADGAALQASIESVFTIDAPDTLGVYGGSAGLVTGLRTLGRQLGNRETRDLELTRYSIGLMHLQRHVWKRPDMLAAIGEGLEQAKRQRAHYPVTHPALLGSLAHIYETTLSTLRYRIHVNGERNHLSNPDNVNKIRALLLCGVRSAVLLRQCGGRVWTILWERNKMLQEARALLAENEAI